MRIERYDLFLAVDPPARSFAGTVGIRLTSDPGPLRLNAVELEVRSVRVDGRPVPFECDPAAQELRFDAGPAAEHTVECEFSGKVLPDGLTGLYVSPFGPGAEILTSQMYPTGARRTFPCRDAPAEKAEFHVTLRVPRSARVVFNTDAEETREEGETRTIRFRPTPRMSTYLLYFGIGPFEETGRSEPGLRTIVAHPPGRSGSAQFALEHAARFVREYESYYAIPYPLPKLHLVAVPSFWAGAMENWGAIAFRETSLLVDDRTSSTTRRYVRMVLAHEIAHQWFGNLVTNAWWKDFWLNEAFATFVAARIVDRLHPGEGTWSDLAQVDVSRGFALDAQESTHPVEVEIERPEQIGEIADGVTYGKGASLLRMIESFLGEAAFRRGVTAYLNEHQYGAASGADLWSALDRSSGVEVSRVMRAWVTRPGHPVLDVRRDGDELVVSQRRFRYHPRPEASDTPWPVPLELAVDGKVERRILEGTPLKFPVRPGALLRVNPDRPGFYHVRYDPELARETVERWDELSELDQWGLLLDRRFFLSSGDGSLAEYLEAVDRAGRGDRYLPALTAAQQLRGLALYFPATPRLREAHAQFFRRQLARLGLSRRPGEDGATGMLRGAVTMGLLDSLPEVAEELGRSFRDAEASLDPDALWAATAAFVRTGGAEAWRVARERLRSPDSDDAARRLAGALIQTGDPGCYAETLAILEGREFTASRVWDVLGAGRFNFHALDRLWAWYEGQLPRLAERWRGTPLMAMLLEQSLPEVGLGRGARVREYFAAHRFPEAERGVATGLERLEISERLDARLRSGG